jgi:Tfp pilus assembly ATPase PilU
VQSDKASKASASPDSDQAPGNNPLSMNINTGIETQPPSAGTSMVQRAVASIVTSPTKVETFKKPTSPQQTQHNVDSHAAKLARMEVSAIAAQGLAGGVPPKIEEDIEPD